MPTKLKRSSSDVSKDLLKERPAKRRAAHDDTHVTDHLINVLSADAVKEIMRRMVRNPTAGPVVEPWLKACEAVILRICYKETLNDAASAFRDACLLAQGQRKYSIDIFTDSMVPFLDRIEDIRKFGQKAGGPQLAWDALIKIASFAVYRLTRNHRVVGEEKSNDYFHEEVDTLMFKICVEQAADDPEYIEGRRSALDKLRRTAMQTLKAPLKYRYKKTLDFLSWVEGGKTVAFEEWLAKRSYSELLRP